MVALKSALRRLLPRNAFARGVSVLVGGTAGAQMLMVLAAPVLTRLYTPEDFGLLAVYAGLLALVGVVASLRYELAIPLPEDDDEAAHLVVLCLLIVLVMTALALLAVVGFGAVIAEGLGVPALAGYLWLLPVGVLLGGAYSVFNYWAVRTKEFGRIAGTRIRQALATIAIQLAAFKLGGVALLLGQVAGQSVGTTSLTRPALALAAFKRIRWRGMVVAADRYRRFPIFSTWDGVFNTASIQLPPILLAAAFGSAATGLYSLAHRVISLPISIIGSAIGQVFFSKASEANREGKIGALVTDTHRKLAHIGLPPMMLLIFVGPDFFVFIFGPNWKDVGELTRWMTPWIYFAFVSSPLSTVFVVLERQNELLKFQFLLLACRVLGILIGMWHANFYVAVMFFSLNSALCYAGLLIWINHLCKNNLRVILIPTISAAAIALACSFPLYVERILANPNSYSWFYAMAFNCLMIAGYYLFMLREAYQKPFEEKNKP